MSLGSTSQASRSLRTAATARANHLPARTRPRPYRVDQIALEGDVQEMWARLYGVGLG